MPKVEVGLGPVFGDIAFAMQCYTTCEDITPALRREAEKSAASQRK